MSEPAKLQDRLKAEFADEPSDARQPPRDGGVETAARSSSIMSSHAAGQASPSDHAMLSGIVGCLVVLSAGLVLVTGFLQGFHVAALSLGVAGLAGALLLFRSGVIAERRLRRHVEHHHDRTWEQSETSAASAAIHDILRDIVLVRSLDGRIIRANAVLSDLVGIAELAGLTCTQIGLDIHSQALPHHYDVKIAAPGGTRVYAWHDVTIREPATGELVIHTIARDVTEERRAEHLRELALSKAEDESEAKSRLLATVSHEIRTPLSGILGMSHLIGQTRLTAEQKNYLAGIRQSGHALVQLVDDLLDFSTIEAGRFQLRPSEDPVRPLIEGVVEMMSPRAHEKGIEIGSFVSAEVPAVMSFDGSRLRQVLYNVIGNAVKFTVSGGVYLETTIEPDHIVVKVTDTGPGMTADEQMRVFEAFEQAGGASQRRGGAGLGLAISARILSEAGGALTLESRPGHGSTFTIRMPAALTLAAVCGRAGPLRGASVFLYAPDGPVARALQRTIETLGGTCAHTATATDALQFAQGTTASLTDIIVDNRLSGDYRRELSGLAAFNARHIRRTYLVNPEERTGRAISNGEGYDAWLIRPLRERSLVEVLCGRMKGIEVRDAINDNRPTLCAPIAEGPSKAARILLAEDDPVNAMLVRSMLTKAGFEVSVVDTFPSLLSAVGDPAGRPDLVITDLNMPGGDGPEVVRRLTGEAAAVPVVVLTAEGRGGVYDDLIACGAAAVLVKPAEPKALLAEVARLIAVTAKGR
ncbi:signal transduction histidine kinase/CheY-like chemotaxis protein [Mycoplana sp. BE70]|uniref:hybrid sensor histidine kinase/response regulator n=1 Tax=Mycoplana sp. BE70 TaxID=2817775 RepID=UPI002865F32E|nr:ATP-binding protein [Mycoplana sp. BE70]MDR6756963.1 signal transduction histidine kinase/CheY-like chemotaxis protein [Mycoplana sp. BE70]